MYQVEKDVAQAISWTVTAQMEPRQEIVLNYF
jgi:hypothetical protein